MLHKCRRAINEPWVKALLADWNSGGNESVFGRIRGALEQDPQVFLCKICS